MSHIDEASKFMETRTHKGGCADVRHVASVAKSPRVSPHSRRCRPAVSKHAGGFRSSTAMFPVATCGRLVCFLTVSPGCWCTRASGERMGREEGRVFGSCLTYICFTLGVPVCWCLDPSSTNANISWKGNILLPTGLLVLWRRLSLFIF